MLRKSHLIVAVVSVAFVGCNQPQYHTVPAYDFSSRNQNYQDNIELRYVNEIQSVASDLVRQNRFDEAVEKYQEGINFVFSHPENKNRLRQGLYVICLEQALKLYKQGQFSKAIPAMRLTIENCYECSNKDYNRYYGNLAIMLDGADRKDESIEAARTAISYSPDDVNGYILLAQYLTAVGHQQEALQVLEKAVKIDPENAMAHYRLGASYHLQGQYKRAIESFKKAIELNQNYILAYLCLSESYKAIGMEEESKQTFDKAYAIDPNKTEELRKLILIKEAQKQDKKIEEQIK